MIHVAVGLIQNHQAEVLIAKRLAHQPKGGLWEFPGGKVEINESVFPALQRELKEEIGIDVLQAEAWLEVKYVYEDKHVLLDTWKVTHFVGNPSGREGQPILWVPVNQLKQFDFPEGNRAIIEKLCNQ